MFILIFTILESLLKKLINLYFFIEYILSVLINFFQLNLIAPLKNNFKILSSIPDFFLIGMFICILCLILAIMLEDYEKEFYNNIYFIKIYNLLYQVKKFFVKFFQFFKVKTAKFLDIAKNSIFRKITKFVFVATIILFFFGLFRMDLTLYCIFVLFGLCLFIITS
jgi:uncharacterized membrane protein YiaA